ncbi:hypothetical protein L3Q82_001625 [Scortum barcoo]|uniref:Uncharacterized protein n=1 Tax=Scortum barcoo TaxID=214431 RepID=A0ACB8W431_9TELE|nr:hypothetical protein L3Q82_001625 [Scortum barcoo]
MESPAGALSSTPPRDSKKAGYSVLLFGPCRHKQQQETYPPNPKAQGSDLSFTWGELQHVAAELGAISKPTPARRRSPWATPE